MMMKHARRMTLAVVALLALGASVGAQAQQHYFKVTPKVTPLPTTIPQGSTLTWDFTVANDTAGTRYGIVVGAFTMSDVSVDKDSECKRTTVLAPGAHCNLKLKLAPSATSPGHWFTNGNFGVCTTAGICTYDVLGVPSGWNMNVVEGITLVANPPVLNLNSEQPKQSTKISNSSLSVLATTVTVNFGNLVSTGKVTVSSGDAVPVPGHPDLYSCPNLIGTTTCSVEVTAAANLPSGNLGNLTVHGDNFSDLTVPVNYANLETVVVATPPALNLTSAALTSTTVISNLTANVPSTHVTVNFGNLISTGKVTAIINRTTPVTSDIVSCPDLLGATTCSVAVTAVDLAVGNPGNLVVRGDNFPALTIPVNYHDLAIPHLVATPASLALSVTKPTNTVTITNDHVNTIAVGVRVDFGTLVSSGKLQGVIVGGNTTPVSGHPDLYDCPTLIGGSSCVVSATRTTTTDPTFSITVSGKDPATGSSLPDLPIAGTDNATASIFAVGDACYAGYKLVDGSFTSIPASTFCGAGNNYFFSSIATDEKIFVAAAGFRGAVSNTLLVGNTNPVPPLAAWTTVQLATTAAENFSPEAVAVNGTHWVVLGDDKATLGKVMVASGTTSTDGNSIDWTSSNLATLSDASKSSQIKQLIWSSYFNKWLAVGITSAGDGIIYTNTDAAGQGTWTAKDPTPGVNAMLFDVSCMTFPAVGDPVCLAVGADKQNGSVVILKTTDGENWQQDGSLDVLAGAGLNAIANNGQSWLAVGVDLRVYARVAGIWEESTFPTDTSKSLLSAVWDGTQWVVTGTNGLVYLNDKDPTGLSGWTSQASGTTSGITRVISY